MFAREYLSVASRWARDQLRQEGQPADVRRHLEQLIEAADALGAQIKPDRETPPNVVQLADHARRKASTADHRREALLRFLDR